MVLPSLRSIGLAAACLAIASCGTKARPWNVLLVTFDTTRADRIGCYGNDEIATPTLDGLAAAGVRFANAFSAAPITAPSHSTILTGRYPWRHGVWKNPAPDAGIEEIDVLEMDFGEEFAEELTEKLDALVKTLVE